ncbi:hypothetical protein [Flavobacterium sp.]|jgi:hypothetical protein|uniref:hypothetical protein n=1 Tax=Flavobacterium sp. TaxID=239 RepID=UPI0037C006EB
MSNSFKNTHGQTVTFTHQDQDLLEAYHRVKRFQIKNMKDLKGLIVNVRATYMLENCFVGVYSLCGKPRKMPSGLGKESRFFAFEKYTQLSPNNVRGRVTAKSGNFLSVGTLIGYNISFKHNSKVLAFVEKLKKADRFQQECILKNKEYTELNFYEYNYVILNEARITKSLSGRR